MDLFRILGGGARFDRKRFRDDIEIFNPNSTTPKDAQAINDPEVQASLLNEIDFFKTTHTIVGTGKKKNGQKTEAKKHGVEQSTKDKNSDDIDKEGLSDNSDAEPAHTDSATSSSFQNQEAVYAFRKSHRIRVYGTDVPNPFRTFDDLASRYELRPYLRRNLTEAGYDKPTSIQMQAVPIILHGRDVMACAPTGSGKTLAFILPILHDLNGPEKIGYRALIISPTRELAQQIFHEIKKMSVGRKFKICVLTKATAATQAQDPKLRQKFDILISTPLRLVHALQQEEMELDHVRHLVLDEADKLLDLGFLSQTDEIFAACTHPRLQKSLFSATIPAGIESLASTAMRDPLRIVIGTRNAATETITQQLVYVGGEEGKLIAVRQLVQRGGLKPPVLVFVQSIERAKELFHELVYDGINVDVIHSERTKAQRDRVVEGFRAGRIWILIATELMARGLDFKGVNLVINYDFPQTVQSYIHRVGRTGRAGRAGEAITYFTRDDAQYLKSIVNVMKESGCDVPDWMLTLKKPRWVSENPSNIILWSFFFDQGTHNLYLMLLRGTPHSKTAKKNLKQRPVERGTINTMSSYDKKKIAHKRDIIENQKKRKAVAEDAEDAARVTEAGTKKKKKAEAWLEELKDRWEYNQMDLERTRMRITISEGVICLLAELIPHDLFRLALAHGYRNDRKDR
ncbi:putative ROK1-ATP-dependent RNA helicase [Endogone sp. FLAS-F59071]|nr:putative ROK1-ATP-dependent RNA helicase [Endogone sp. FLAS-F59071]|eukprot:RUS22252.1 putative ROK1-ATP-dependent RNA helicase [Endogone sp. FLAS-F59071]